MNNAAKPRVLLVEDDLTVQNLVSTALDLHGYVVSKVCNGQAAIMDAVSHGPSLIMLDLGLPDIDGIEVITKIRSWSAVPIIVISARTEDSDKIAALDAGADDYLTKPFGTVELLARIRTALRHTRTDGTSDGLAMTGEYHVGDLCIDYNKHRVFLAGEDTHLTPNEYAHALSVNHSPRIPYIQTCRCSSLKSRSPLYRSHVQNQNLTHGSGGLTVPYPQNC